MTTLISGVMARALARAGLRIAVAVFAIGPVASPAAGQTRDRAPGAVAAYDAVSGFGLVRTLVPISGRPLELGDAGATAAVAGLKHRRGARQRDVVRAARGSPAESAGLQAGDVIVGIGRDKIRGQEAFYRRLWDSGPAGTTITPQVLKDGEIRQVPVTSIDRLDGLRKPHGI
ncbi:MAG: PDZ domain-containing protein [Burkholderiaceae bacterium]